MPDRPSTDPQFIQDLNDYFRLTRELARKRDELGDFLNPLQTFDKGLPMGDTKYINFGPGIAAALVGPNFVELSVAAGNGGWDAIVDETFAATDTAAAEFRGIGEALSYLDSLGLTRALVLVRPGTYTETANWTAPETVYLFGTDNPLNSGSFTQWRPGAFSCTSGGEYVRADGISILPGATTPSGFIGAGAQNVWFENCHLQHSTAATTFFYGLEVYAHDCLIDIMRPMASTRLSIQGGEIKGDGGVNITFPTALTTVIRDVQLVGGSGGGLSTWTVQGYFDIQATTPVGGFSSGAAWGSVLLTLSTDGQLIYDVQGTVGFQITTPASGKNAEIRGIVSNITLAGLVAGVPPHRVDAFCSGTVDIATAIVDLRRISASSTGFTFRGGVNGSIHTRGPNPSSGTYLNFISAFNCVLHVTASEGAATGTAKPFAFDAASADNLLIFSDHDQWPVAGTGAGGTNNNWVVPPFAGAGTGTAPNSVDYLVGTASADLSAEIVVGTTPGGELGGTWPSPTVDTTHSGSSHAGVIATHEAAADPHTGYQKESEKNAANGYVGLDGSENATIDGVLTVGDKVFPGTPGGATQSAAGLYAGTGAPNNANGNNGDFYLRSDGGALSTIYHKRLGAWVGVV